MRAIFTIFDTDKSDAEVFGDGMDKLVAMTRTASKRIIDVNRYWRFFPVISSLERLGFKYPAIYGFGIRGKALRKVLLNNDIEIAAIFDQKDNQEKPFEVIISGTDADVIIVSILDGEDIALNLRSRVDIPVYTLEELIDGRVEQAPKG